MFDAFFSVFLDFRSTNEKAIAAEITKNTIRIYTYGKKSLYLIWGVALSELIRVPCFRRRRLSLVKHYTDSRVTEKTPKKAIFTFMPNTIHNWVYSFFINRIVHECNKIIRFTELTFCLWHNEVVLLLFLFFFSCFLAPLNIIARIYHWAHQVSTLNEIE